MAQPSQFPSDGHKIFYMITRLDGQPLLHMNPLMDQIKGDDRPELLTNYKLFVEHLRSRFGYLDDAATAARG